MERGVMNRLSARLLLLTLPLAAGAQARGQAPAARVEEAKAHGAKGGGAARVAPLPQHLFGGIPLATHSEEARKDVELALDKYENALLEDAAVHAKHATEKDPHFALGFAVLAFATRRGVPDHDALARAKDLLPHATPSEQLLVRWMTSVESSDLLPAITSMNDLLKRFPKDKHVLYLTAEWLYFQQDYDRSRKMFEQVLQLDPNFPPALNMLGYSYIETGDPDPAKAIASLKRYAELQPGAPNPEDSLGEVSRYAGDDKGSLEHYGAALQIDPLFFTSQLGLGDTLTLMGDYANAREEYDRAIKIAETPRDMYHARFQKALVYFWEGQAAEGRKALAALREEATKANEPYARVEIATASAMLAENAQAELQQLQALETLLNSPLPGMSESDQNSALGAVLREEVRIAAGQKSFDLATQTVAKLEKFASRSRDLVVAGDYESSRGYLLFYQEDLANAADELVADSHSPLALLQLAIAQEKLGNLAAAEETRTRLKYQRAPIVEWYLVTHSL
jgi:tetratricopeptide (TPR) repeat protein